MAHVRDRKRRAAGRDPLLGHAGGALGGGRQGGDAGHVVVVGKMLAHGAGVEGPAVAQVVDVEGARVGAEQQRLRRERVHDGGRIGLRAARRDADLGGDLAGLGGEVLDY